MLPIIWISILVFVLIVLGAILIRLLAKWKFNANPQLNDLTIHPKGYWISLGMSIGAGMGVALGLVFDNLGLGIPIGVGIGLSIGAAVEQRNREKIPPLTKQEKTVQKWGVTFGGLLLLALAGMLAFLNMLRTR